MAAPVAIQLYSVRQQLEEDFDNIIRQIADMGYVGVEPAGFPGTSPQAAAKTFQNLDLQVCSAHLPLPISEKEHEVIDVAGVLGCKYVVSGCGPDQFKDRDGICAACEKFNQAAANVAAAGLHFSIHNHWWEFGTLDDGTPAYKLMLEQLDESVLFQLDTYWVQTAGASAADVVAEIGARAPLLHIKDGPCEKDAAMTAVGDGQMDFPAVIAAGEEHTEWLIVELDRCDTDMLEAVAKSYEYLVGEGLAEGRK